MRVLLTRPADDSARLASTLGPLGATCLIWPLTRIVPVVRRVDVPAEAQAILFTSANGVRTFSDLSDMRDLPVLAVGERTAALAREAGFAQVLSAGGDAADLARLAVASGHRRFFHPRGREATGTLADALAASGCELDAPAVYAAEPADPPGPEVAGALASGDVDLVTIWSPRNARLLAAHLSAHPAALGGTDLLGLSANAVEPLRDAGFRRIDVAERADGRAMVAWIRNALRQ